MINTNSILNKVLLNINPQTLDRYSYSRILIKGILADFLKHLADARTIYRENPDMFYATLKMNDSFMLKIPKDERAAVIEDITQEFIARLNNHLIKHPDRLNQQQFKIRPHVVIENRDVQGNPVMEHSHSILMISPFIRRNLVEPSNANALQYKAFDVHMSASPFETITHGHRVHLINDCHSIQIYYLAESKDVENTLGYDLKTAAFKDHQNAFAVLDYQSQEAFYEKKRTKRQSAYSQVA